MLCDFCKKQQATIFLSQIFKGEIIKLDLCEACAKKLQVTDVQGVAVNELVNKIRLLQEESSRDAECLCPACGMALNDVKQGGQLGCPDCYRAFSKELIAIFEDNQKALKHVGKSPRRALDAVRASRKLSLEVELQAAIEAEDFKKAADLRDKLSAE